ncbi:hypothetical protein [Microbacterium sp. CH1]|uniref:hypothetical protein n=1 Tax=Microbacterium sp. CH1 TaxID=1770208 RepID=UPI000AC23A0E|nr:hypothetical protein [Microbacterium sp. CH1]
MSEIEDLRARLRVLEQENEALRRPRRRISARSIIAGIVLVVAVLLAPIAAMGTWARLQLVDADRFVATFAPLAEDPDVQDFVADQVTAAIDEQVDLDAVVGELFDGLRALDLPPRATAALGLLEAPAASGLSSLIDGVVHEVVSSQQFADIWAETLRFTHERAVAILQDEPGTALDLSDDGVLSVDVGAVVERVKEALAERGAGVADLIPVIDRTIPVVQADALVLVRTVYQIAVTAGFWLPWVVLGLVVLGVLLAVNRPRALFWTSAGFALVFLLLAGGMGIGRGFFVSAVSPSIMTASAAESLFDQLTALLGSTIVALALVGVLIALWAWLVGSSHSARTVRGVTESGFGALRDAAEARGISTGRFGRAVDRYRGAILIAGMAIGVLILLATRPVTFGAVLGVAIGVLVLTILVELLRRPGPAAAPEEQDAAAVADAGDPEITRGG